MFIFQCVCLCITFFVLQYYISAGIHVRTHRLLPMLLTTIALYDFYEIVKYLSQAWAVLTFLEVLLSMQMIYVLLLYVFDFIKIKLPIPMTVVFFIFLFTADVMIFRTYPNKKYLTYYYAFLIFFTLLIFALATYAILRYSISRKEHYVTIPSYISLMIPGIALALSKMGLANQDVIIPASLAISCLIFYFMMKKDLLSDTETILMENLFTTSNNAYFIYDKYFYYINCNKIARKMFPKEISAIESKKRSERYVEEAHALLEAKDGMVEYELEGKHYICRLREIRHRGYITGYIISMIDITHQKNELSLMEKLKKAAEEISNKKTQIMIQTSHDLRSPLHTIIGSSDILMQRKILDGNNLSLVQQIKNAGKNLLLLVNDMLEFTKMEAGDITLESSSGFLNSGDNRFRDVESNEEAVPKWIYPEAKALIADDMKLNLYIFKELISPWKIQVDTVVDGNEAIEAVKNKDYDIIFLDRLMPEKDGLETCIELKQMTQAPIILLSANMSEYDVAEYEPYGFNDYMPKPFSVQRLKNVVEHNISKKLRENYEESALKEEKIEDSSTTEIDNFEEANSEAAIKQAASTSEAKEQRENKNPESTNQRNDWFSSMHNAVNANISNVVLSSYAEELDAVKQGFYQWLNEDTSLLRTKVHGIKGISRQVGFEGLGEVSEVMEMAAKANHVDFIKRYAKTYLEQVDETIKTVSGMLPKNNNSSTDTAEDNQDLDDLFDNF